MRRRLSASYCVNNLFVRFIARLGDTGNILVKKIVRTTSLQEICAHHVKSYSITSYALS